MARHIAWVGIALLLATIIHVAIAWGASLQQFVGRNQRDAWIHRDPAAGQGTGRLSLSVSQAWFGRWCFSQAGPPFFYAPQPEHSHYTFADITPPLTRSLVLPWLYSGRPFPPGALPDNLYTFAYGFPFLSLYATCDPVTKVHRGTFSLGLHNPAMAEPDGFPLLVNVPAFALNTLFWFALIYVPPSAWIWFRQRRRRKLNLCLACGYGLSGVPADAPCPECGKLPGVSGLPKADPA